MRKLAYGMLLFYPSVQGPFWDSWCKKPQIPTFCSFVSPKQIKFCWHQYKTWIEQDKANCLEWDKFKTFLQKSFIESTAFTNIIWNKIKRDMQYQQKKVQDWASYLKHLQYILIEFDMGYTPIKDVLYWNFYKGLQPSIRLWIDKKG